MPGRRPIDINQQTHDARGNLKGAVTALPDNAYALKSGGLIQFGTITSEQFSQIIIDKTGYENIVFADSPYLVNPYLTQKEDINKRGISRLISFEQRLTNAGLQTLSLFPSPQQTTIIPVNAFYSIIDLTVLMELSNSGVSIDGVYPILEDQIISKKAIKMFVLVDFINETVTYNQYCTLQTDQNPGSPFTFGELDLTWDSFVDCPKLTVDQPDTQITYYKVFGTCIFTSYPDLPGIAGGA
jgi:hypothetical protein